MKTADYKLPFGVHPLLEPRETGRTPSKLDRDGNETGNKPIYEHRTVSTPEPETLQEFIDTQVEQDKADEHTLNLAQAQLDIIRQRKIREAAQSQEVSDMLDGKAAETKDLSEDERIEYVMQYLQEVGDNYRYGTITRTGGSGNAAAKKALESQKKLEEAAKANPELAAKKAELDALLASMGIAL